MVQVLMGLRHLFSPPLPSSHTLRLIQSSGAVTAQRENMAHRWKRQHGGPRALLLLCVNQQCRSVSGVRSMTSESGRAGGRMSFNQRQNARTLQTTTAHTSATVIIVLDTTTN